jgi:hypothetical protein
VKIECRLGGRQPTGVPTPRRSQLARTRVPYSSTSSQSTGYVPPLSRRLTSQLVHRGPVATVANWSILEYRTQVPASASLSASTHPFSQHLTSQLTGRFTFPFNLQGKFRSPVPAGPPAIPPSPASVNWSFVRPRQTPSRRPGLPTRIPSGRPGIPAPPMGRCITNKSSQGRADTQ